jgi:hypothetical protein
MLELAAKMAAGAVVGGLVGLLIGRARACSSEACNVHPNVMLAILGGAFFGAAVAYALLAG